MRRRGLPENEVDCSKDGERGYEFEDGGAFVKSGLGTRVGKTRFWLSDLRRLMSSRSTSSIGLTDGANTSTQILSSVACSSASRTNIAEAKFSRRRMKAKWVESDSENMEGAIPELPLAGLFIKLNSNTLEVMLSGTEGTTNAAACFVTKPA